MKISKVIYLLFGGGILAIVAILIAFYQPNSIEEKEVVVPLVKEVVDAKPIEIKTTRKQSGETIKLEVIRVRPDGSLVIAGKGFPNSKIEIISGSKVIAKTTSDKVGEFIAVPEEQLSRGEYLLSFRQINKDGDYEYTYPSVSKKSCIPCCSKKEQKDVINPKCMANGEEKKSSDASREESQKSEEEKPKTDEKNIKQK